MIRMYINRRGYLTLQVDIAGGKDDKDVYKQERLSNVTGRHRLK